MTELKVLVEAMWDQEAKVWIAASDDVPGLATEAETLDDLARKLGVIVPELLAANGLHSGDVKLVTETRLPVAA